MIEPIRDRYGPEADRSHLADWLELLAWLGTPLDVGDLLDYLKDNNWTVRSRELFYDPGLEEPTEDDQEGGAGVSPPEDATGQILGICERRLAILGDLYPFELGRRTPGLRNPHNDSHRPYLALLALTAAHHYNVECDAAPEDVFERVVAEVMDRRGLRTCDVATLGRSVGDFRETVRQAATSLGLVANADAAPSRSWANDEGVDTISLFSWGDTRPGHWIFIGQATVGASGTWESKLLEPAGDQWAAFMTSWIPAIGYLAIPHHIEDKHLEYLTPKRRRLVLDRLRLVPHIRPPSRGSPADAILEAVRDTGIYDPRK